MPSGRTYRPALSSSNGRGKGGLPAGRQSWQIWPIASSEKPPEPLPDKVTESIARALTAWFSKHARDLPWRKTRDPYRVWVSEIMLQQTRVETVKRFYGRFLERFPSVKDLAQAGQDDVLAAWSGLGYYRRARLLHKGAQYVRDGGGEVPNTAEELRAVPGIGRYTAGAIASIAYDRPAALVDGNVARVSSRLHALEDAKQQDAKHAIHWSFAQRVLEAGSPRILAQALMELGATVCTPKSPKCEACPVRDPCRARSRDLVQLIPAPKKRQASPVDALRAVVVVRGKRALLEQRPAEGLLASMWCTPLLEEGQGLAGLAEQLGCRLGPGRQAGQVKHVFTHRVWLLDVVVVRAQTAPRTVDRDDGRSLCWIEEGSLPPGGLPKVSQKILAAAFER